MSRQINAASSSSSRAASASSVLSPIQNGERLKEKFIRAFHLEHFIEGYKTTREFSKMVDREKKDSKMEFLSVFDQLSTDARFQINVEIWMNMYLMGNVANSHDFKKDMKSLWYKTNKDSHIREMYRDKSETQKSDRIWKSDRPKSVSNSDGDRSAKWPNHLDDLHVLFDIVHLVDNGQVKMDDVKKEYEFLLKKNKDHHINPLLLILSVFHRKLQCHSSREAPLGDEFVDVHGKVFDRRLLECGPGYEDFWKRKNPEYHLLTTKCEQGPNCRWLHNGQKICLQYMLHGQCSNGKDHRHCYDDDWYDDYDLDDKVCQYAHLCLVCHIIQRQAHDAYKFGQATPYRRPCHLVSPGEAKLAADLEIKRKTIKELNYLHSQYNQNMKKREKVPEYDLERYDKKVARCPWRYPESIDTFIAECECQTDKDRRLRKKCSNCKLYHVLRKHPNFDPDLLPYVYYDTRSEEEAKFVNRFTQSINNIEYIKKYDLALDITKYLEPWEYDEDYSPKYPQYDDSKIDADTIVYRARVVQNKLIIPGMYIPNKFRPTEGAPRLDPVLTQVSTHDHLYCHVTRKLQLFMKRINQRPFSRDRPDIEPTGNYYKPKESYNYESHFLLTKSSFDVLRRLIALVIKMPAYQQYISFSKKNPLPRHRTEFRGNIEPAAGLWDKKAYAEALRIKKEEEDRIEEEGRAKWRKMELEREEKERQKAEQEEAERKERERAHEEWMSKIEAERRLREEKIQEEKERLRNYTRNGSASSTNKPSFASIAGMRSNTTNRSRGNSQQTSTSSSRGGGQTVSSSRGGAQTVSSRGGVQASSSRGGVQTSSSRGKGKKNAWTRLY